MNYVDIVLIILLFLAAISGFRNGFISELASLAALILGILGAIKFSDITADFLIENLNIQSKHIDTIAFIMTFIVIVILVHIIGGVINKIVKTVSLGFLNRLAGMVFGVLKSALILSVILVIFDKVDKDVHILPANAKTESRLYKPIHSFAPGIFPVLNIWSENSKT
jgi:membrane protein required for colicin V production